MTTKRRRVTDEEFAEAYADPDNYRVLRKVLSGYSRQIPPDELEALGMYAVWYCLAYHREGYGQKFTTNLYGHAHWQCNKYLRRERRRSPACGDLSNVAGRQPEPARERGVLERVDSLPHEWQRRVIRQRFVQDKSVEEIALVAGSNPDRVRRQLREALASLRELCGAVSISPTGAGAH